MPKFDKEIYAVNYKCFMWFIFICGLSLGLGVMAGVGLHQFYSEHKTVLIDGCITKSELQEIRQTKSEIVLKALNKRKL